MANMKEKIQKTEEEWKSELSPEQYQVCRMKATEPPFTESITTRSSRACTDVLPAGTNCLIRPPNSIPARDGLAFTNQFRKKISRKKKIQAMECPGPKSCVADAERISATSFPTGLALPAFVTVSIPSR